MTPHVHLTAGRAAPFFKAFSRVGQRAVSNFCHRHIGARR